MTQNARDLTWDQFTAAQVKVGTVTKAGASNSETSTKSAALSTYELSIDFGSSIGTQTATAVLDNNVFKTAQALVNRQLLAVVNLEHGTDTCATSVLSVGSRAVLQPAKQVDNGFILA